MECTGAAWTTAATARRRQLGGLCGGDRGLPDTLPHGHESTARGDESAPSCQPAFSGGNTRVLSLAMAVGCGLSGLWAVGCATMQAMLWAVGYRLC
jgi:hypothetical protein